MQTEGLLTSTVEPDPLERWYGFVRRGSHFGRRLALLSSSAPLVRIEWWFRGHRVAEAALNPTRF